MSKTKGSKTSEDGNLREQVTIGYDVDENSGPVEWTETAAGERARETWARRYYERDGAPESDEDR